MGEREYNCRVCSLMERELRKRGNRGKGEEREEIERVCFKWHL